MMPLKPRALAAANDLLLHDHSALDDPYGALQAAWGRGTGYA